MSTSVPAKYCPRCNTLLPAEAPVCGVCGLQFTFAPAPVPPGASQPMMAAGAPPSGEQFVPESWPQSQPGWPSTAPGYAPQAAPGPLGYAPAAVAAPPRQIGNGTILIGLAAIIAIIAAVFYVNANHTASPAFDRHGLQANVPLPDNSAFYSMKTVTQGGIAFDEWIWTVSNNEPAGVQQFYKDQLPNNGWKNVQPNTSSNTLTVIACQSNQALIVGISQHLSDVNAQGTPAPSVDAPQGGSAFGIILSSDQQLSRYFCPGQQTGGNTITLGADTFSTDAITIAAGATITFVDDPNMGTTHILIIGINGNPESEDGAPDFGGASGHQFKPGDSWTTPTWDTPGIYHVTCEVHPTTMNLTVTVTN